MSRYLTLVGLMRVLAVCIATLVPAGWAAAQQLPTIRVAVLKFGTVNWLMDTIEAEGLDRAQGFDLEVVALAGKPATSIAFQSGDADLIVGDWVWAMRQSREGAALRFSPYSTALGALVTNGDPADLCGLDGRKVGVVGGATDKSWLVLQALAAERCGFDLAARTEALYGAPPLMSRQLETGAVAAVATYWPFAARLEAAGMTRVIGIAEALDALGIRPAPALVGFIWRADGLSPALRDGFLRAVAEAGALMARDDATWERLRPLVKAADEAEFVALRDAYRAGIPGPWTAADTEAAVRLHALLLRQGGEAFGAGAGPFDADVFFRLDAAGGDAG